MPPAAELLVHISAPCLASDDARYRKEAQEYLRFKSANRQSLHYFEQRIGGVEAAASAESEAISLTTDGNETEYSNVDLSSLKTPGQIPQGLSKINVARTPLEYRPPIAPESISCINQTPFKFPHGRSQPDPREQPHSFVPDSQIPRSPTFSASKRLHHSRSPSPNSLSSSPSSKRRRIIVPARLRLTAEATPPSPSQELHLDWKTGISDESKFSVFAPPKPSNGLFKTYVTPSLALITAHLPLSTFYISFQAQPPCRRLNIHERGHWSLSISSFSAEHKKKVWAYLERFIGAGSAGRVSCFLEEARQDGEEEMTSESAVRQPDKKSKICGQAAACESKNGAGKEEFLKVYCMGEVVPSIWLLLFMATTRQIKGRQAQWIDASGMVVVQMQ